VTEKASTCQAEGKDSVEGVIFSMDKGKSFNGNTMSAKSEGYPANTSLQQFRSAIIKKSSTFI